MRVKSRLSSYPVLSRFDSVSQDYKVGNMISANISLYAEFNSYKCDVTFSLKCKTIEELIHTDKAMYCVHVECPSTCYRKEYLQREPYFSFSFLNTLVNDAIEINTFIILTEDITDFTSEDFHPDYEGMSFSLKKHQIIAIGDAVKYTCEKKNLDKISSIIKVMRLKDDSAGVMTVNTDDSNYITIGVQEETFNIYYELGQHKYRKTAMTLILYPALIVILERMYIACNQGDPDTTEKHWYQVIEGILAKNGKEVSDLKIQDDSLLKTAQLMFGEPVRSSFEELRNLTAKEEENV